MARPRMGRQTGPRSRAGVFLLYAVAVVLSVAPRGEAQDLVTRPVDAAQKVVLRGHHPAWAAAENDVGAVPGDLPLRHLTLVLARSAEQEQALEQFLSDVQNPSSAAYHHWLSPVEMGERFGATQDDIEAVTDWLQSQGLHVDSIANSRIRIHFSGTAAVVGAAFVAELHYYSVQGERRISVATDPQIPAALAGVVEGITGLFTVKLNPQHNAKPVPVPAGGMKGPVPEASFGCPGSNCAHYIFPADFATIYGVSSVYSSNIDGTGQNIGIVGRARVNNADVENFQSLSGLAKKDPTVIIPPLGKDPGPPQTAPPGSGSASQDQSEATLDVMRSGGVAPGATIDLVASASTNTADGVQISSEYIVDTSPVPAHIMSISFGACESQAGSGGVSFWNSLFAQAAGEGISVFVSSGDSAAAGCDAAFTTPPASQTLSPNYICSSGFGTCVGGTEFADAGNPAAYWSNSNNGSTNQSALGYIPEGGWNEPVGSGNKPQVAGSGGGVSSFIATPSWQKGTGVPGTQGRYTPDVAFSASGHDGYFGCFAAGGGSCVAQGGSYSFEVFSGTSAAAPDMAGIAALLNQKEGTAEGNLNPTLYQLAATPSNGVFNDVTVASSAVSGCVVTTPSMCNNSTPSPTSQTGGLSGYLVGTGYDEVTGLGSLNVANLLSDWGGGGSSGSATTTALTSSANPATAGVSITFTATVTTSGSNTPTGSVTFKDGATTLGSGTLNASRVATFATSALSVGAHSITAAYSGDANNAASTSAVLSETIQAATTTTLTSSANPISSGNSVTFTATVAATGSTPTGSVSFKNGTSTMGTGTVSGGMATFTTSSLIAPGTDMITAVYGGDADDLASTSATLNETVNAATFTLSASPANKTISAGQSASYTITVTPQGSFTSQISFACGFTPSSSATCGFNPANLTPNSSTGTTTLMISGAAVQGRDVRVMSNAQRRGGVPFYAFWMPMEVFGVFLVGTGRKARRKGLLLGAALLLIAATMCACGGGSSSSSSSNQTQSTSYQVQVTATAPASGSGSSAATTQSTTLTLTVQ